MRGAGGVVYLWLGVLVRVRLVHTVSVSDLRSDRAGVGTYIELHCFIGRTLSFGKGSCCSVPSSSGSKVTWAPAKGRWPLLHFWTCSFSRLNGRESERISRRSRGDVGLLVEVADMFSDSTESVSCCSVERMAGSDGGWSLLC